MSRAPASPRVHPVLRPRADASTAASLTPSKPSLRKALPIVVALLVVAAVAWALVARFDRGDADGNLVSGNGRIEATEVDVATRLGGRVTEILVGEGEFVQAGQVLARMQVDGLRAQRDEAFAALQRARHAVAAARAEVALRQSDVAAMQALIAQREAELDAAQRRLARSETLAKEGASSRQDLDDDRARVRAARATLAAAQAQAEAARAAVTAAEAQVIGAGSGVAAAEATVARIEADIADSELKAPRAGRVQFRLAQPGEVLAPGGKVLNLVDLSDVYMTFFLPETVAGRVALGGEVRLVLDAAPQYVIPAAISYVASTAQFTPRTVETASERQKLMFRVRAQIPRELLLAHLEYVKTGLPGVAWVKLDREAAWPERLGIRLPQR